MVPPLAPSLLLVRCLAVALALVAGGCADYAPGTFNPVSIFCPGTYDPVSANCTVKTDFLESTESTEEEKPYDRNNREDKAESPSELQPEPQEMLE